MMPRRRGKILAIKWGLNPNSSSLGVDVTFLLFGAAALSLFTPMVSALVRWRTPGALAASDPTPASDPASVPSEPAPAQAPAQDPERP